MLALLVGTVLAVGALAYVLFPLLVASAPVPRHLRRYGAPSVAPEQDAVVALREIEFDRATGKLSDGDYDELRTRYTQQALAALRVGDGAQSPDDEAEAAVSAFRSQLKQCTTCGPRPEPDATYCSSCGKFLPGVCGSCGASVTEPGAAFCISCGRQLAA
jgi:hypothetical protein